jgi:hypothetical protein
MMPETLFIAINIIEEAERAGKGTTGDKGSFMAPFMGSARTPTCRARRPSGGKSGGRLEEMQTESVPGRSDTCEFTVIERRFGPPSLSSYPRVHTTLAH